MSCESAQRAAATRFGAEIALAIGLGPHEARDVLLEVLDLAQSRAAQRIIPGESDKTAAGKLLRLQAQADDAAARDATIACFQAMAVLDPPIALPSHGEPDPALGFALPKLANQHAWRAVWATVEAARDRLQLPELAREILAARRGTAAPPLPDLLPNLPAPPGIACFAEHAAISGPGTPLEEAFGSKEAAAEVLGRVWAAERQQVWSAYILGTDIDREHRTLCRALMNRLAAAGIPLPECPPDSADDLDAFRSRTAYATVERVLQAIERGERPENGMPPRVLEAGVLPALPPEQRARLDAARADGNLTYGASQIANRAGMLHAGAARDALVREAMLTAISIKAGGERRDALAYVAARIPSPAELDELIGMAAGYRAASAGHDAIDALIPFLDSAGLARWEQRSPRIRAPKAREALDAALARERMERATTLNFTCVMCGRPMGLTAPRRHQCPGPSRTRLRSLAIATQARRAIAEAAAETASLLAEANARLDQIAESLPADDPVCGLIARDRIWMTAGPEQKAP